MSEQQYVCCSVAVRLRDDQLLQKAIGESVRVSGQGSGPPGGGWEEEAEGMCKGAAELRQHA